MAHPDPAGDPDGDPQPGTAPAPAAPVHPARPRLTELDALRGVAALLVIAYHYLHEYPIRYDDAVPVVAAADYGQYGVHLFFMISGFVIYMTVERVSELRGFVTGRFSRLYPAYWAALGVTFLVLAASPLPDVHVSPAQAVVNLTMFEGFLQVPYIDGAYWSLTIELSFYVLIAALLVIRRPRWTLPALWALAGIYVVGRWAWTRSPNSRLLDLAFNHATLFWFANLFAAGILFYLIVMKHERSPWLYAQLGLVVVLDVISHGWVSGLVIASALALMGAALVYRPAFLRVRPVLFLGAISYSLYLVHQNVGYVVIHNLDSTGVPHWGSVFAAFVLALLAATALNRLVERPAQAALRRRFTRPTPTPAPAGEQRSVPPEPPDPPALEPRA